MDAITGLLGSYGVPGLAGAILVGLGVIFLVFKGDLVTKTMLTEVRANDRDTIATLKEANKTYSETLPDILKSLQSSEYALDEIQKAGKGARRD